MRCRCELFDACKLKSSNELSALNAGTCAHDSDGNPPPLVAAGVDPRFVYARNLFLQDNTGWQGTSACIGPLSGCSSGPATGGTLAPGKRPWMAPGDSDRL